MPLRRNYVPQKDATVVRRLRDAGAIILGNLKMTEGAHADHRPPVFEAPLNPWGSDLWPGASSSGSGVATAAGLCYAALATDTGGSIRLPAAVNGVTGLMPTWGRVSRAGVFEFAATLDHVGPLTRSAADAGVVLGVMAGPDPDDPTASFEPVPNYVADLSTDLHSLRIGVDADLVFAKTSADMQVAIRDALHVWESLGAKLVGLQLPDTMPIVKAYLGLSGVPAAVAHAATYAAHREEYGQALSAVIELGRSLTATEYHRLQLLQMEFRGRMNAVLQSADVILLPVLPFAAPTLERMRDNSDEAIEEIVRYTSPIDVSGHPAIAIPCGLAEGHRPVSLQLVGPHFGEGLLVAVADAFQRQTDWHRHRPLP
jgi:amidase